MSTHERRADERAALDAIRAVEDVARHKWLRPSGVHGERTPDLRLTLCDGRTVTVEITMATVRAAYELQGAASRMRPKRAHELSHEWKVAVSDHDIVNRDPSRRLDEFVGAMIPVLASVEARGGTPHEQQLRATAVLDPDRYSPYRSKSNWWVEGWLAVQPWDRTFEDWVRDSLEAHCDYWYPPDIVDCFTDHLEPRHVHVLAPPEPAQGDTGGIHVYVAGMEHGFRVGAVDHLSQALQKAINKKHDRGQMANARGERWLAVPLDGNNAAGQLEGAFGPEAQPPYPDLSAIELSGFDEIWAIAKMFGNKRFVVLRLSRSSGIPRFCTVDMP